MPSSAKVSFGGIEGVLVQAHSNHLATMRALWCAGLKIGKHLGNGFGVRLASVGFRARILMRPEFAHDLGMAVGRYGAVAGQCRQHLLVAKVLAPDLERLGR